MLYNLGNYRYSKGKIYKQVWWFIYRCVDHGPYTYLNGVRIVNTLGGTTVGSKQSNKRNKFGHPDCVRLAKGGVVLTKSELIHVKFKMLIIGIIIGGFLRQLFMWLQLG